jgi:hypothetical protein
VPRDPEPYPQAPTFAAAVLGYLATGRVHELPDGDLVVRIGHPARYRRVSPTSYSYIQRRRIEQRWGMSARKATA